MKKKLKFVRQVGTVLGLVSILFSYAMFQGGFVSWFLFYSFLPFGLCALAIAAYPLRRIQVTRTIASSSYYAGDTLTVAISLHLPFFVPLAYVTVEENWPLALQQTERNRAVPLFWRKTYSCTYIVSPLPRGEHVFSAIRVTMTDWFGLVRKEASFPLEDVVVVYPRYVEMKYRKIGSQLDQGGAASSIPLHRDMTMAVGVREYVQGDRFSWIHWKASARKNELMTKEFEERQSDDIVVVLDRTPTPLFEEMVTFTASFLRAAIKKGVQTGLISVGSDRFIFPARNGEAHLQQLFYHLAKTACDSPQPLARILQKEMTQWPLSVSVSYVTSQLTKETAALLSDFAAKNRRGTVFLIKRDEHGVANEERDLVEQLRRKGIITIIATPEQFANALVGGS
ncbi:uncharacterized protein (DUF58 family) [Anoxybacillus voinovskiensis]|uniref:Uncharacterized protein (DUF58 family) n=1 Tax=Anoxybacteroides voinovskiense TaxID=230470 RepID=A0A840DUY4_9BACL|nr:DUF58 domain-containing protein [Anoxybacillus voinovskiensis]MBB4075493.1 uncharacterized protein (DUF58 family) [Anoxybacillus voinovskiensis]GGJ79751.1 hypothetical protein GCM10008982_31520 [Anoxybacillus voinovskiensis]